MQRKVRLFKSDKDFSNDKSDRAKEYPIENLYTGQLKKTGRTMMGLCPFHEEDTPSFHLYPETNSWYCFACGEGGDVINFYMRINDVDFQTAIEALAE